LDTLPRDLRLALRALSRSPGFVAAVVVSLGLAIGANTAIFTLVNAVLLRPIPGVRGAEALVNVHPVGPEAEGGFGSFSYLDYLDLRDRNQTLSGLAAFNGRGLSFGDGEAIEVVGGQLVSGNYFPLMGVRAHLGRLLEPRDDAAETPVAVVSHGLWQRRLGSDPAVAGRTIRLNGYPFTVVGVTEPGFSSHFIGFPFDVFVPLSMTGRAAPNETLAQRDSNWLELVGRLRSGVSIGQAQAELSAVVAGLAREHPAPGRGSRVELNRVTGLDDSLRGPVTAFLGILQAVAGLVLAVACANAAGLLLARAAARRRDVAVRIAIGARMRDLVRPMLAEALILFGLAGGFGLLLAAWSAGLLVAFQPRFTIPLRLDLSLDLRVLAFTACCALATGLAFGLVPAREAARLSVVQALKDVDAGARSRLRRLLLVGQVALSLLLLTVAGLFLRALERAKGLDPGFAVEGVRMASVNLSILGRDEARGRAFFSSLLERLESTPGVQAASLARQVPLSLGSLGAAIQVPGHETPPDGGFRVELNAITPRYFETLSIPLLAGRAFAWSDSSDAPPVAIVSQALARRFWPERDPLGQRIEWNRRSLSVVGVVQDSACRRLGETARPLLYVPFEQSYSAGMAILVRSAVASEALGATLRREIRALDADLPILSELPLAEYIGRSLAPQRMAGTLSSLLGGLGMLLTALGIHGLIAQHVARRRREVGVRVALGARPEDVTRLFLAQGLHLALAGVALGLVGALTTTRLLAAFLPGVSPLDPVVYAATAALMLCVAGLASFRPARRAARLDPRATLRE
jgi:predicted permease